MKMYRFIILWWFATVIIAGCDSKTVNTETEYLNNASLQWLPLTGNETLVFENDTSALEFHGTGEETYFENVRYKSDLEGMFKVQENYYADMQRRTIQYVSDSTNYVFTILQKRCKGDIGDWDELYVTLSDGFYYENAVKIITYKTAGFDYGESMIYTSLKLDGKNFANVYYNEQERRPQNLYVNKAQGIVGFNTVSDDIWTISVKK